MLKKNIFVHKKILIYGLGKSGISSFLFLKKNNEVFLYDDKKTDNRKIKKKLINKNKIDEIFFDYIVISPGIDINKCSLRKYLKKNIKKIITDLDIFFAFYKQNRNIAITGTNGKSTTAKILHDAFKYQKKDVRLVGNIGNPVLSEKRITKKTIFVIEVSSYQIEYSKHYKANFAIILNISPDHLERHGTFKRYIKTKFKLITKQGIQDFAFLNLDDGLIKREINKYKINSKIIDISKNSSSKFLNRIKNPYFLSDGNKQNLSFIFSLSKKIGLNKKSLFNTINNFKCLKYRQEVILKSKKITLINDSKATSFSSSINILKSLDNVYWIIGGIPKKGDNFLLSKKDCLNFKAYIFGKNKSFFINKIKNKINYQVFNNLKLALKKIIFDFKSEKRLNHLTILFSPAAASFDSYKNFEDRGLKFNNLVKELKIQKIINGN